MIDLFLTYKKFTSNDVADDLIELLEENAIEFELEKHRQQFEVTRGTSPLDDEIVIKLKPEDFEKVNLLLIDSLRDQVQNVKPDYYLYSFTDDELMDVVTKADEWSEFDVLAAQKILKDRGREISADALDIIEHQRLAELVKYDKSQTGWIIAGYVFAILGGLISIFIGWYLSSRQKTLPNGQRIFIYNENDRRHGRRLMLLGAVSFFIWTYIRYNSSAL